LQSRSPIKKNCTRALHSFSPKKVVQNVVINAKKLQALHRAKVSLTNLISNQVFRTLDTQNLQNNSVTLKLVFCFITYLKNYIICSEYQNLRLETSMDKTQVIQNVF
jgi:hypothetical protein